MVVRDESWHGVRYTCKYEIPGECKRILNIHFLKGVACGVGLTLNYPELASCFRVYGNCPTVKQSVHAQSIYSTNRFSLLPQPMTDDSHLFDILCGWDANTLFP